MEVDHTHGQVANEIMAAVREEHQCLVLGCSVLHEIVSASDVDNLFREKRAD